jgi:hypothetical protein
VFTLWLSADRPRGPLDALLWHDPGSRRALRPGAGPPYVRDGASTSSPPSPRAPRRVNPPLSPLLAALRDGTRDLHDRTEAVRLNGPDVTPRARRPCSAWIAGYYARPRLRSRRGRPPWPRSGLDLAARRKAHLARQDLAAVADAAAHAGVDADACGGPRSTSRTRPPRSAPCTCSKAPRSGASCCAASSARRSGSRRTRARVLRRVRGRSGADVARLRRRARPVRPSHPGRGASRHPRARGGRGARGLPGLRARRRRAHRARALRRASRR